MNEKTELSDEEVERIRQAFIKQHACWFSTASLREILGAASPSSKSTKEADAARWRWLVSQHNVVSALPIAQVVWKRGNNPQGEWVNLVDGGDLIAHVDRALASSSTKEDGGGGEPTEREAAKKARPPSDAEPWVVADDTGLRVTFRDQDAAWRYRDQYTDRLTNPTVTFEPSSPPSPLGDTPEQQEQKL